MSTDRPRGPGYEEIANHYRRKIDSGELQPGAKLPTVREVQTIWNVSNTTAAAAMAELRRAGLTIARPRVGTVVADPPPVVVTGVARIEQLIRTGKPYQDGETKVELIRPSLRSCNDPYIADQLGIELDSEIVLRVRLFSQDGQPKAIGVNCIHPRALAIVPELVEGTELPKFWQLLYTERTGESITPANELFHARPASNDELAAFNLADVPPDMAVPVLVSNVTFHTDDGQPIEVWEDTYAPGTRKAVPRAQA
ncbi:GntR family transcriptional regulator [Kitasatospora sp. NPDC090091]|uniref:GntR family transcriptional regulator n=1 Tax=Kitasatospora sp. NPDC090091 TaxID=3364081 RepID=UPI0037F975C7